VIAARKQTWIGQTSIRRLNQSEDNKQKYAKSTKTLECIEIEETASESGKALININNMVQTREERIETLS
jgi:hypothetical protein